jgi:hypothetical protein
MLPAMENGSPAVRAFLDSFVAETVGELFESREACIEFYSRDENFAKLERGEIGDNLMYRYRAIASFHLWDEVCNTAMAATRQLLEEHGVHQRIENFDEFWNDFHTYIRSLHATGRSEQDILSTSEAVLNYDFSAWLADAELRNPEEYRLRAPTEFVFSLDDWARREMQDSLAVWTTHIRGLSKLVTRIKVDAQVRTCHPSKSLELAV